MHIPRDRTAHITAFDGSVVDHWYRHTAKSLIAPCIRALEPVTTALQPSSVSRLEREHMYMQELLLPQVHESSVPHLSNTLIRIIRLRHILNHVFLYLVKLANI